MSLGRTIRSLEQAIAQSRVGWTSQPFMAVVLTEFSGGAGPLPDQQHHALGESGLLSLFYIARSSSKTRRPQFTSQSNKSLAKAPFASNVICRRPKPECVLNTNGRDS
jgi:hypothetical protein